MVRQVLTPDNCSSTINYNGDAQVTKRDYADVLANYLALDDHAFSWSLLEKEQSNGILKLTYHLQSQIWPITKNIDQKDNIWQHQVDIYVPDNPIANQAFLYVNGGYNKDQSGRELYSKPAELVNFSEIARTHNLIAIDLHNVPNQFLQFSDHDKLLNEDSLMAYGFAKFLQNPDNNAFYAPHLPMAKAIITTMDMLQTALNQDLSINIEQFILSGKSKRGWAVWLSALEDERITAIIPIVADFLNIELNFEHICSSYKLCPIAMKDYINAGILPLILDNPNLHNLMQIEDPFRYLDQPHYQKKLSLPKFIINASGDDFFTPDSAKFYFHQLPGEQNILRYVPNSGHNINAKIINEALNSYLYSYINNIELPLITWQHDNDTILACSSKSPLSAKLWLAQNQQARDFRYNNYGDAGNIRYHPKELEIINDGNLYQIKAILPEFDGWQAGFIELAYDLGNEIDLIASSEVFITPDIYPA